MSVRTVALHPFTVASIEKAKAFYEARTKPFGAKGSLPNYSIHRKPVYGQGFAFHGHVNA